MFCEDNFLRYLDPAFSPRNPLSSKKWEQGEFWEQGEGSANSLLFKTSVKNLSMNNILPKRKT